MIGPLPILEPSSGAASPRYEQGMNFAAVLKETQGGREDLPAPPDFDGPPRDLAERARRALYEVADPELPISVLDLGLLAGIAADEETGAVTVSLTYTSTACPCMDFIQWDIRERLLEENEIQSVTIDTVWDPPWTTARISERGREILGSFGVAT